MAYFLDTNTCIYYLNNSSNRIAERLESLPTSTVRIPSMVAAELLLGAEKSARRDRTRFVFESFLAIYDIAPFDENSAKHYALIRSELERQGRIIGGNDLIIAATALASDGILVTHNTRKFARIADLPLEDWF